MEMQINTAITDLSKIRLLFHNTLYNNNNIIYSIIDKLKENFALFSIEYNESLRLISIKIKKTDMKKNISMFQHTSNFYYMMINKVFFEVIQENIGYISEILDLYRQAYGLSGNELASLSSPDAMSLLYNATTQMDNIIVISL